MDPRATIRDRGLHPWDEAKPRLDLSAFATRDAKRVARRAYRLLRFELPGTMALLDDLPYAADARTLAERRAFVASLEPRDRSFLARLRAPRPAYRNPFTWTAATEDEDAYRACMKRKLPCVLVTSPRDLEELSSYELVLHDLDVDLENGVEGDLFLFDHLRLLSGWKDQLDIPLGPAEELRQLVPLLAAGQTTARDIESEFALLEDRFAERLDALTLSGSSLVRAMSGRLPPEVEQVLDDLLAGSPLEGLVERKLPLALDREAVAHRLEADQQSAAVAYAERALKAGVSRVPELLGSLELELLALDFEQALIELDGVFAPTAGPFRFANVENRFLASSQPIGFELETAKASVLTGANSGGKTTLLELIIQIHVLASLGLGFSGPVSLPGVERFYYFAKNSGSASRGAFETLLEQLAKVRAGPSTLVLADEIEAVTEPGVAGLIIAESVRYFLESGTLVVVATHLGREIEPVLPEGARIDGIEATGLTDDLELEVDHEPRIGRRALDARAHHPSPRRA